MKKGRAALSPFYNTVDKMCYHTRPFVPGQEQHRVGIVYARMVSK